MNSLLKRNLKRISSLCEQNGVRHLELFGSAAEGSFIEGKSDFDFLVEFQPCSPREHYERFFQLCEGLENFLQVPVDLVETCAMTNPFFIDQAEKTKISIYAA